MTIKSASTVPDSGSKRAETAKRVAKPKETREECNIFPSRVRCYSLDGVINIDFGFRSDEGTIKIQTGVAMGKTMAKSLIDQLQALLEK